jgi:hypothetical protein
MRSSGLRLCFVICACSLAISDSVTFIGGLAKHPFRLLGVMLFVSGCTSLVWSPFSPWISQGRNPVCTLRSSFRDSSPFAEAMSISHFSVVGGCIDFGSSVYVGFSHWILKCLQ